MWMMRQLMVVRGLRIYLLAGLILCSSVAASRGEPSDPPPAVPPESTSAPAASAPAPMDCDALNARLAESEREVASRGAELERALGEIAAQLKALENADASALPADANERKEKLAAQRAAAQDEQKHLNAARTAWQAAVDACGNTKNLKHDLDLLAETLKRGDIRFAEADVAAIQAELNPLASTLTALTEAEAVRSQRLAELVEKPEQEPANRLIRAERGSLLAEVETIRQKRGEIHAKQALLEARLAAARESVGPSVTPPSAATSAPAGDEAAASVKQHIAKVLETEARDRLEYARAQLKTIEAAITNGASRGEDVTSYENDRVYWNRVKQYEQRRLQHAELHLRAARQKEAIGQLRRRIAEAHESLKQVRESRSDLTPERREEKAAHYREQAAEQVGEAAAVEEKARIDEKEIAPLQELLPGLDAVEAALRERLQRVTSVADARQFEAHFRRMRRQLDDERQQIDLVVTTMEVVVYAKMRQATLIRELADIYTQCADTLVPPVPSFWERNRSVFNSVGIVLFAFAASFAVRFLVWLVRTLLTTFNRVFSQVRFSVKRVSTLLGFIGSIMKVFVWVFAIVAMLNEFGIDPAASTGALGLIGLIMAGMFQQIVIDFVKGLDIIASRHYNVGDFIEVDGKCGHVVDFNVKYTRIRTVSGQEYNVPNSRCVPSRRFPDGCVDNYVDFTFASSSDADKAVEALDGVCADLNRRIEPMKERPEVTSRFREVGGRVTVRYIVRVLPGCAWVITDHIIPSFKTAASAAGVELATEPTTFFINHVETFRKLFSRRLTEEEIIRGAQQDAAAPPLGEAAAADAAR